MRIVSGKRAAVERETLRALVFEQDRLTRVIEDRDEQLKAANRELDRQLQQGLELGALLEKYERWSYPARSKTPLPKRLAAVLEESRARVKTYANTVFELTSRDPTVVCQRGSPSWK